MPFFFIIIFFLSYASHPFSCTTAGRRILHEPFFPLQSFPPSQPPTPSPPPPPQLPFSTSAPDHSPFFPSYPSPPPPSPTTFASFPANISSLILPHSSIPKRNSHKLLALSISALLSVLIVLAFILFFYYSRHRRNHHQRHPHHHLSDHKPNYYTSHITNTTSTSNAHKLRTTSSTRSDFLYLPTFVNDNSETHYDPRKLESPELHPLPPLNRQVSRQSYANVDVGSTGDDEEEEFYSPRGSLAGRESSIATGSGSRRVFAAVRGGDSGARSNRESSCTSSNSGSPACSQSPSISPPVSENPRPKSPESSFVQDPPASPPSFPPPMNHLDERGSSLPSLCSSSPEESPRISLDFEQEVRSSSLSSASTSPASALEKGGVRSLQVLSGFDPNVRSPSLSPASITTDLNQKIQPSSPHSVSSSVDRSLDKRSEAESDLDQNVGSPSLSSASKSPSRALEKSQPPRLCNDSDGNTRSSLLFSTLTCPEKNKLASPRNSNYKDRRSRSPSLSSTHTSPARGFGKSLDASPTIVPTVHGLNAEISTTLEQPIAAPPPPPPPPPLPPQPPRRSGNSPVASTATGKPISKPPALVPPSRPFVLQSTSMVSPLEFKAVQNDEDTPKPKLKPLHWDKVRASSEREMVWDHLRSSSFKLNEEMIETLFVVNNPTTKPQVTPKIVLPSPNQDNWVLDPKKAQNIAILLRAINVTIEEVCEALLEGNVDSLGTELLESLLKMAPSREEERKLKEYKDDSPIKLGHAEKFLKAVLDVPFAFKRVDAMLYVANFDSEVDYLKKSFETLESASEELRSSRMFLKLLEAVLKTGNRMNVGTNRGDAHAFKLDTLLKLVDVKGADGQTTLLHFVVQEIIRTEGARLSGCNQTLNSASSEDARCRKLGLQVVSGISSELNNVKKAASMDSDVLINDVSKLSRGIEKISEVVRLNETMGLVDGSEIFSESMKRFIKMAEEEIIRIQAQESVALSLVKEITEYFHGNSAKEEAHPFRIFMVVRDFLNVLDRVCKEVGMINERTTVSSAHKFPVPVNPTLPQVFCVTNARKQYSYDDEDANTFP
ncbi:hypothetical protein K2173_000559 [Erythroxylum novogranatense]|uniref:Formin-like protein n=1 Tax=Erythroxylum novogranatense TaxID=1862640 RepID=A0AAV8S7I1_9ROSI|nr:hypothetical protein K2173_000559 [Erythroxylum novogranatense]